MSQHRRIKSDSILIAMQEKMPLWAEAVGGPISISSALVEHLITFGEQLDPSAKPTALIVVCLRQIGKVLRANIALGRAPSGMAELIGFSLSVSGETNDLFIGVRVENGTLFLYAPTEMEDVS